MMENQFEGATPQTLFKAVVAAGNEKDKLKARKQALADLLNDPEQNKEPLDDLIHMARALGCEWGLECIKELEVLKSKDFQEVWHDVTFMRENLEDALKWQGMWPLSGFKSPYTEILEKHGIE